ncbi:hypothetical protein JOQ06_003097, partial [Pogonophryne albipinna]
VISRYMTGSPKMEGSERNQIGGNLPDPPRWDLSHSMLWVPLARCALSPQRAEISAAQRLNTYFIWFPQGCPSMGSQGALKNIATHPGSPSHVEE